MATNKDGTWELVDGVQRLSTLVQFAGTPEARTKLSLHEPLALDELEKLSEFNGMTFANLPESLKLQFWHRPIKVITLSDKSDLVVRFDLFERLNTGGVVLTNQEIRACIYRGEISAFLERMAGTPDFLKTVKLTQAQEHDGTREECVLRFFAFLYRYQEFVHSVVDFLNVYMKNASESFEYAANEKLFLDTFKNLSKAVPNGIVRSPTRKLTPLNLFEAVAVGAALALKQRGRIKATGVARWLQSVELRRLTTGATNDPRDGHRPDRVLSRPVPGLADVCHGVSRDRRLAPVEPKNCGVNQVARRDVSDGPCVGLQRARLCAALRNVRVLCPLCCSGDVGRAPRGWRRDTDAAP